MTPVFSNSGKVKPSLLELFSVNDLHGCEINVM